MLEAVIFAMEHARCDTTRNDEYDRNHCDYDCGGRAGATVTPVGKAAAAHAALLKNDHKFSQLVIRKAARGLLRLCPDDGQSLNVVWRERLVGCVVAQRRGSAALALEVAVFEVELAVKLAAEMVIALGKVADQGQGKDAQHPRVRVCVSVMPLPRKLHSTTVCVHCGKNLSARL